MGSTGVACLTALLGLCVFTRLAAGAEAATPLASRVERWGMFEITLKGPSSGNPFVEVDLSARFAQGDRRVEVRGFYDGDGMYRVRFMPDRVGEWRYETRSNRPELAGAAGVFACAEPAAGNHGPVGVRDTWHLAYADGTPYRQIGTTCYAWTHQGDALEERTLATLRQGPFNKLRMCVFPKRYAYNRNDPPLYPFEGTPPKTWDLTRPNPAFFRHLERRVADLRDRGIEADLILFHPYDGGHWGFDRMDGAADDRYLRYLVARLAACRNVWWSLANEFDLMQAKKDADWDRFFQILQKDDPYGHLRSIHQCSRRYDHAKPWVTHVSIQDPNPGGGAALRRQYGKPVIFDECCYEGDIEETWGNISAQEMVHRFWAGTVAGVYVGHGETYFRPDEILWWSKGGVLHGQSPPRIAFLRKILEEGPPGLDPFEGNWMWAGRAAGREGEYYLFYFGVHQPSRWALPDGGPYRVDLIDTWEMTVTPLEGPRPGKSHVDLPGKPGMALRVRKVP